MLKWLTIEKIKGQLRMEPDFHDEDEILLDYGESAEDAVLNIINRTYEEVMEVYGRVPAPVRQASLLIVGSSYKDRENQLVQQVHDNPAFSLLLKPYMKL